MSNDIKIGKSDTVGGIVADMVPLGELKPTMRLRWVEIGDTADDLARAHSVVVRGCWESARNEGMVLQQFWWDENGAGVWKDVEIE